MIWMRLFSKRIELSGLVFLFISCFAFAGDQVSDKCDFNFKVFENEIIKQIPPSMILARKSNWMKGEMHLKIEGAQTFILNYVVCNHLGVSIKADNVKLKYLEKILDFSQSLVFHTAPGMADIFKSLKPYMASTILSLEIRDYYFSTMDIETIHNEDGTINIKISASGG